MSAWEERRTGWLNRHKVPREPVPAPVEEKKQEPEIYCIDFPVLRCPKQGCGSKDVRTYTTRLPERFHVCAKCGYKFKSIEQP